MLAVSYDPVAMCVLKEIDVTEIRNQNAIGTEKCVTEKRYRSVVELSCKAKSKQMNRKWMKVAVWLLCRQLDTT